MATWVTHAVIADKLFEMGLVTDEVGFVVGSIGPDCNVENDNWTEFTPSKEVTHWMKNKGMKLSADYEEFYETYISSQRERLEESENVQEYAFLLGYYAHLIADVETQRFIRSQEQVKNIFKRLKEVPEYADKVAGQPEVYETLRAVFHSKYCQMDFYFHERDYLKEHPKSKFETVLRQVKEFPDYLPYFPKGAVSRKLQVIDQLCNFERLPDTLEQLFFVSREEFEHFVEDTSSEIWNKIQQHSK